MIQIVYLLPLFAFVGVLGFLIGKLPGEDKWKADEGDSEALCAICKYRDEEWTEEPCDSCTGNSGFKELEDFMSEKMANTATNVEELLPEIGSCYYDPHGGAGVVIKADPENDEYTILWQRGQIGTGGLAWTKELVNRYAVNYWVRKALDSFFENGNGIKEDK